MKQNIGIIDRIIRVLLAILLFYGAMAWVTSSWLRITMSVVGGILLVTSVTGFCALYKLFRFSTTKQRPLIAEKSSSDDSSDTQEPLFKG
jgi:hypothetical protein